jgi:O-antigen/teichoic acid export membrane protein
LTGGLVDQAIVSFGNFALNIALARSLSAAAYGDYCVTLSFILLFNALHQAFVAYPLSVKGASDDVLALKKRVATALVLTLFFAVACLPIFIAGMLSIGQIALMPMAAMMMLCWQMQETVRRGLLAHARFGAASLMDLFRYGAPVIIVMLFYRTIGIETIFPVLALVSFAALIPILRRGVLPDVGCVPAAIRDHWRLAAPVLGANLLAALSTQWFLWLLAWRDNPTGAAALVALTNIVAIASPLMIGIENILVPEVARIRASHDHPALLRLVRRRTLACLALIAPFDAVILAAPNQVTRMFYGQETAYHDQSLALRLLVVAYGSYLLATIFSAVLRGCQQSGAVLRVQLFPALAGLSVGSWLTWHFGILGAALAAVIAGLLRAGLGYVYLMRLRADPLPARHAKLVA